MTRQDAEKNRAPSNSPASAAATHLQPLARRQQLLHRGLGRRQLPAQRGQLCRRLRQGHARCGEVCQGWQGVHQPLLVIAVQQQHCGGAGAVPAAQGRTRCRGAAHVAGIRRQPGIGGSMPYFSSARIRWLELRSCCPRQACMPAPLPHLLPEVLPTSCPTCCPRCRPSHSLNAPQLLLQLLQGRL
jgi:hypothetical protein